MQKEDDKRSWVKKEEEEKNLLPPNASSWPEFCAQQAHNRSTRDKNKADVRYSGKEVEKKVLLLHPLLFGEQEKKAEAAPEEKARLLNDAMIVGVLKKSGEKDDDYIFSTRDDEKSRSSASIEDENTVPSFWEGDNEEVLGKAEKSSQDREEGSPTAAAEIRSHIAIWSTKD